MKVKNKRVGDIYFNPLACDIWILNKIWNDIEQEDIWTLNLIHEDYQVTLDEVDKFEKIGNIYDLIKTKAKIDKVVINLKKSIKSIDNKLNDKEIRVENGRVINPPNDYRIVRLKAIRTKCKEILDLLK